MDKFNVNIYIETSNRSSARSLTSAGMYIIEFVLKSGEAVTRQGILTRERITGNALSLETLCGAFKRLTKPCCVTVNIENPHILNVMNNHYLPIWEKGKWIRENGKPVSNVELWQQLSEQMKLHAVTFRSGNHSYRNRMQFDIEKAMEAYRNGKEYHPDGKGKRMPAVPDGSGGYWILW